MTNCDWYIVFRYGVDLDAIAEEISGRIGQANVTTCTRPGCSDRKTSASGSCQASVSVTASGPIIVFSFTDATSCQQAHAAVIGWLMARADYVADLQIETSVGAI